ncbi:hypothetical protein Nepgr_006672 [Nepenthes gracilis]|uniref:Uncharacterized protein n=1 Tax=Nepenthes gracilis TaxID=150966 RepID=A0AAD3S6A9_NEPGR|nr:hypothetical protein Nepgr_006672 [Nepenthes gracilis]
MDLEYKSSVRFLEPDLVLMEFKDVGVPASTGNTFAPLPGSDLVNCLGNDDNCPVVDNQLVAIARDEVPVSCNPSIFANADPLGSVVSPEPSAPFDPCNQMGISSSHKLNWEQRDDIGCCQASAENVEPIEAFVQTPPNCQKL